MSDMQAVKVILQRLAPAYESRHLAKCESFDRDSDELFDYCKQNKLKYLNGVVYSASIEELDPYGFVTKTRTENGDVEIVALWYNGGAYIDEVLEKGLRND